jgi:MerR family transcriptional regulator, heat shock protein HspR
VAKRPDRPEDQGVYIISVAAELAGVHPQTLRIYERKGLLQPARTAGNTRRYSDRDIDRLRAIQKLTQDYGINLAGVKMIVEMETEIDRMRRRMEQMQRELSAARRRMEDQLRAVAATRADIVPVRSIPRFPWEKAPKRKPPVTEFDLRKS